MKVTHLYPTDNQLIDRHVRMLGGPSVHDDADILHVHGCWDRRVARMAMAARDRGARVVLTPHGGLEPWHVAERRRRPGWAADLRWQRRLTTAAYAVIAQGRVEAESLAALGWNPRVEVIRNAVVTSSVTPESMALQTAAVYRKVMDSNTVEHLSADGRRLLRLLLKAGVTGDRRWVGGDIPSVDDADWHRLLVYADHENVRETVDRGCRALGLTPEGADTRLVASYLPRGYARPTVEADTPAGIVAETRARGATLRHVVELDRALRRPGTDDERLRETLAGRRLLSQLRRLLAVAAELTGLDEGYWPAEPLSDGGTKRILNQINTHLKI